MTDTITLPRSVVEQALEAFTRGCPPDCKDGMTDSGGAYPWGEPALIRCPACRAFDALRAALEQPDVRIPTSVPAGWKLVPVDPTPEMIKEMHAYDGTQYSDPFGSDDFKDDYRNMLDAAPQPPVGEQPQSVTDCHQSQPQGEPPGSTESAYQRGYLDGMAKGRRDAALDAAEQQPVAWLLRDANNHKVWFLEKTGTPTGYRGEWIKTPLYTRPQPKPLTDEEITEITFKLLNEGASMHDFARAIEAAHGIGGDA